MSTLSLQLYTLRNQLAEDPDATLAAVAEMGLTVVEPAGIDGSREWLPGLLNKHGLQALSAHGFALGDTQEAVLDAAEEIGVQTLFIPFFPPDQWPNQDAVAKLADDINDAAEKAKARGIKLGYHNHNFEFGSTFDGQNSYDWFVDRLNPEVMLELDTFWSTYAGADTIGVLDKYGDRISHIHVKDGDLANVPVVTLEPGSIKPNKVAGEGDIAIDDILAASPDRTWVVEFDITPTDDAISDVRKSVQYIQQKVK